MIGREERAFSPGRAKPAEIGGQEGTVVPFAGSDAAGNRNIFRNRGAAKMGGM